MSNTLTEKDIYKLFEDMHPNLEISDVSNNNKLNTITTNNTIVTAKCKICGNITSKNIVQYKNNQGCRLCKIKELQNKNGFNIDSIRSKVKSLTNDVKLVSNTYTRAKDINLTFKCNTCNYEWDTSWNAFKRKSYCPKCKMEKLWDSQRYDIDFIKNKLETINDKVEIMDTEYINSRTKLNCKCKVCDYEWSASWNVLRKGHGCKQCANEKLKDERIFSFQNIKKEIEESGKILLLSREYLGANYYLDVKCIDCGKEWSATYSKITNAKNGCPSCNIKHGWSRSDWVNLGLHSKEIDKKFDGFKLYKIRMYNEHESFYKIGISYQTIKERFRKMKHYNYEIIEVITSEDGEYIWNLEKELHRKHREYKYIPNKEFGGMYECFTKLI